MRFSLRTTDLLVQTRSALQTIEIFETPAFGRVLALDGLLMTSERDEFFYHEMISHPPLTAVAQAKQVLIIGGGDGGTAREVLKHDVQAVTLVEIDAQVIEACKAHLPTIGSAWDDPRLDVQVGDGIAYVAASADDAFDVIILDGSDPVGPSAPLFNEAFYRDVRRVLRPGGVFSLQSESPVLTEDLWVSTQHRLHKVFRRVDVCFAPAPLYATGVWSWTCASDGVDATRPRPERLGPFVDGCRYYGPAIHEAAFQMPAFCRTLLSQPAD